MPRIGNYGPISTTPTGRWRRLCPTCEKHFCTFNPRQRYCSQYCKRRAQNRRAYLKRVAKRRAERWKE